MDMEAKLFSFLRQAGSKEAFEVFLIRIFVVSSVSLSVIYLTFRLLAGEWEAFQYITFSAFLVALIICYLLIGKMEVRFSGLLTFFILYTYLFSNIFLFGFDQSRVALSIIPIAAFFSSFVLARFYRNIIHLINSMTMIIAVAFTIITQQWDAAFLSFIIPYSLLYVLLTVLAGTMRIHFQSLQGDLRIAERDISIKTRLLEDQYRDLIQKQKKLNELNQLLSSSLSEKTKYIKQVNEHLIQLAFNNAHMIRGPLARILGLIHINTLPENDPEKYYELIRREALDLDVKIREFNKNLHDFISDQ